MDQAVVQHRPIAGDLQRLPIGTALIGFKGNPGIHRQGVGRQVLTEPFRHRHALFEQPGPHPARAVMTGDRHAVPDDPHRLRRTVGEDAHRLDPAIFPRRVRDEFFDRADGDCEALLGVRNAMV